MNNRTFEFVVDGIVLTTVSTFGLVGTLLSIRVLLKPNLRNSFSTLLVGLAACDANFLLCAVLIIGLPKSWLWYQQHVSVHVIPVCNGLISVGRTGSVYLTMAVTLERYFAIVKPLSHFGLKKFLLPAAITFACLYNVPRFFELEKAVFSYTNETMVVGTKLRHHPLYVSYYMFWSKVIFLEMVPYVTIIVLNALIVKQILASYRFRRSFQQQHARASSLTRLPSTSTAAAAAANAIGAAHAKMDVERGHSFSSGSLQSDLGRQVGLENGKEAHSEEASTLLSRNCESDKSRLDSVVVGLTENPASRLREDQQAEGDDDDDNRMISLHVTQEERRPRGLKHEAENLNGISQVAVLPPAKQIKQMEQEMSLGITLVSISVLFIACQSVKIIPDLYELTCEEDVRSHLQCPSTAFIETLTSISNLLSCFNSAANFLIYMLRGKKFRDVFLESYGCRGCSLRQREDLRRRRQQQQQQLTQQTQLTTQAGSPQSVALASVCSSRQTVVRQGLNKTDSTKL